MSLWYQLLGMVVASMVGYVLGWVLHLDLKQRPTDALARDMYVALVSARWRETYPTEWEAQKREFDEAAETALAAAEAFDEVRLG